MRKFKFNIVKNGSDEVVAQAISSAYAQACKQGLTRINEVLRGNATYKVVKITEPEEEYSEPWW